MIPTLYDKTGNNKIGVLSDCIECLVEEERNGIFELTMIYPANSSILESIVYDNIIVADANDYLKSQKFRVYNTRKLMANRIEVCARHISFDLVHDWIDVISIENQSCEYALNTIFRNSQFSKHFKGYSDIINAQNFKVNKVTCLEAIGGTSGSIIDTYGTGAEILRDNTDIHVLNRRGHDNDVTIEYRKNLTGLEVEEDTTDLVTRIMPYAIYTNSNNEEVEVRGDFVNSPLINNYAHPYVKYMDYSEEFEDGEVPTKTKLNNLATKEYTINKIDIPKCNYKIEFIPLSKCAGYEGLEDRINLCDVVTVKDSRYNIDTQAKVIKVVFDVLRGRYDSMELGEPRTTLGDIIGGTGDGPIQGPPGPPGPQGPAGADGSIGDFPQTLPEVPNITAKVYGFANIELSWTFENKVYYSYELYASKTKGFTPNAFNLIFSGQASTYLYQAEPNETWYFRACALNTHGQRTKFSEEVEVSTVKISDLSNYVESAAIGDALIGELNLGRGWYGELKGNYIDARQLSVTDGSGKRTLDIDSFGNVNLDVTSLKIKNNSVATESFVSNAKNDAINSANNNTAIALENHYTKSETDGKISVAKNEITSSVSSTYETKTEVANKINAIQVGGTNLLPNTKTLESGVSSTSYITSDTYLGLKVMRCNNTSGSHIDAYYFNSLINVEPNTEYTLSFYAKGDGAFSSFFYPNNVVLGKHSNGTTTTSVDGHITTTVTNSWKRYWITWKTLSNTSGLKNVIIGRITAGSDIYICGAKFEKGNKASEWSPCPDDIETTVSTIEQRVSTAESKITDTAITNTVKKNFYTKEETNNAITSKGYATQSQLQQTANNITSTVSQNYYTKQETENTINNKNFATKSEVQQTANDVQFKFSQSGGYNLIRNGNPKPWHEENWWVSANGWWYRDNPNNIGIQTYDTNEAYAGTSVFKVQPGASYSFSCWLFAEHNTKGADVYFVGSSKDDGSHEDVQHLFNGGKDGWTHVKASFTTGSNTNYGFIRIDNNGALSGSGYNVVFFNEVQLVQGRDCFPMWSPNPNEIYDGITTIDKSGINVSASNINGYTKMTANGFFVNKGGKDLVSVDGYGLRLFDAKIQLTHANGNKYFLLDENGIVMYNPANGTHQWGKVAAINNKFTVASNGNSSGLSLGHHVNGNYVEDILCDSNGVISVQRQMNHDGVFYNNYGQMFVRQPGQGGWEITGRSDSQSIKPGGANQGAIGSDTQYINQSWIANRYNPSSLEFKHLSHYVDDLECLKLVSEVQPARYFYKEYDEEGNDITTFTTRTSQLGLIYEDVRECEGRDLITNEEDKAINLYNMVSTLWGAVRNLNKRLNELEVENLDLKSKLTAVEDL